MLLDNDPNPIEKKTTFLRPFRLFLLGGILMLIISVYFWVRHSNAAFDLQMHDTYFVIALCHIPILFSLIFFLFAGAYAHFYFIKKRPLNSTLGKIHFALTFLPLVFFLSSITLFDPTIRRYISGISVEEYESQLNMRIWIGVGIFVIGQILFLINLGITIFKERQT